MTRRPRRQATKRLPLWRTRVKVRAFVELPASDYRLHEAEVRLYQVIQRGDGWNILLLDLLYPSPDIKDAVIRGLDLRRELMDRLGFLSYGPTASEYVSTCRMPRGDDDEFELAVLGMHYRRSPMTIAADDFNSFDTIPEESTQSQAIRFLREGLAEPNPVERFLRYWLCLERIAEQESPDTVKQECPSCHAQIDTGRPATQRFIRGLFENAGLSAKQAEEGRKLRGKLAHGAYLRNSRFEGRVEKSLPVVEQTAVVAVANYVSLQVLPCANEVTGLPVLVFAVKKADGDKYEYSPRSLETGVGTTKLPETVCRGAQRTVEFGIPLDADRLSELVPDSALPP